MDNADGVIKKLQSLTKKAVYASAPLFRVIPKETRTRFFQSLPDFRFLRGIIDKRRRPKRFEPGKYPDGINYYGYFSGGYGVGEGTRLYEKAIVKAQIQYNAYDICCCTGTGVELNVNYGKTTDKAPYSVSLFHVNALDWENVRKYIPLSAMDGRYTIGVWLWELNKMPHEWAVYADEIDEFWVPSRFVADAVKGICDVPVYVIPYGIEASYDKNVTRDDFGIGRDEFVVLVLFDSNSFSERKNPDAAIKAYKAAFSGKNEKTRLIIKINHATQSDIELVKETMGNTNYTLLREFMPKEKLNALIKLSDVFLSLHRAEGFGLVMAEAMYLGTPVVATGWSSNLEFMDNSSACLVKYKLIPVGKKYLGLAEGQVWAEPDIGDAACCLRKLFTDRQYYMSIANNAERLVKEKLSVKRTADLMYQRYREIKKKNINL